MATFYVLPSRHLLGQRFGEMLSSLFPGTDFTQWEWPDLAEALAAIVQEQADAHLIYHEELDDTLSVKDALMRDFGAGIDDEIIEIHFGAGLMQFFHQRWAAESLPRAA
ncbi:MAG: hypothetical protein HYX68_15095 [Planctomycetes bacterium]|nr:hypothetical protein [Planctomycetota bacterium]